MDAHAPARDGPGASRDGPVLAERCTNGALNLGARADDQEEDLKQGLAGVEKVDWGVKENTATTQQYISPSDALLSPTTKKLGEIKGKRFQSAGVGMGRAGGGDSLLKRMVKSQSGRSLAG